MIGLPTLIRSVVGYEDGCAMVRVVQAVLRDPLDCTTALIPSLDLLHRALNGTSTAITINVTGVDLADICTTLDLRAQCGTGGLDQYLREAITLKEDQVVLRAILVNDFTAVCTDCAKVHTTTMERIMSSFVVDGAGQTHVLIALAESIQADLDCDSTNVGEHTLASSALLPVGNCGMWAWRTEFV